MNPKEIFGTIEPPKQILPFIEAGGDGAGGISLFLTSLVTLIYVIASVVFIFMILWGALAWILSGGNKDAVASARGRIVHAIIGIVILAVAFAIIRLVGTFTGFSFVNQHETYYMDSSQCIFKRCPSGKDIPSECTFTPVDESNCKI